MTLKESTLAAINAMDRWANYIEVFNYMKDNDYYLGTSKTPEKSVASELYKYGEAGVIEHKKNGKLAIYKKKS